LLICDLSNGIVWQADPKTGKSTVFMNTQQGKNSGLNAAIRRQWRRIQ
jgi:sugar lactone lactonase YvrE